MDLKQPVKVRCQRIGCNAMFSEDDNPDGSCQYHDAPMFHDGTKEWRCCKKRSHDFSIFLEIPGCKTGRHTTEKPVPANAAPTPRISIAPVSTFATNASSKDSCSRCRQGFFCSDHGSQAKTMILEPCNTATTPPAKIDTDNQMLSVPAKKVDINEPQTCRNKGCDKSFKEKDNHEAACSYHPGPAVFHDRIRGWKCCDIHVKEFDEFVSIPPCTKGWHNANTT